MSSHHFVREEQATALYIKGRHIDESILMQLLEWNPTIIAHDSILEWINSLNIKLDVLVSDGKTSNYIPYNFMQWESADDAQILQKIKKEVKAARVIIAGDDDTNSMHQLMLQFPENNYALYENNTKHFVLKKAATFKKWVNKDFEFTIDEIDNANVEGKVIRSGSNYVALDDGIITIHSLSNLIISESL
jgi:hypothetical protein